MAKVARKSLIEVEQEFGTQQQCLAYVEFMRWPNGKVTCPRCGSDRISKFHANATTRQRKDRKTGEFKIVDVPARYFTTA